MLIIAYQPESHLHASSSSSGVLHCGLACPLCTYLEENHLTPMQKKDIGVRKAGVVSPRILIFGGSEPESALLYGPKGTPVEKQRNFCLNVVEGKGRRLSWFSICFILWRYSPCKHVTCKPSRLVKTSHESFTIVSFCIR